jgi:hypothetical protein
MSENVFFKKGDLVIVSSDHKINTLTQQIIIQKDQRYCNYVINVGLNKSLDFDNIIAINSPQIGLVIESCNFFYGGNYVRVFLSNIYHCVYARQEQLLKINSIFEIIINEKKIK